MMPTPFFRRALTAAALVTVTAPVTHADPVPVGATDPNYSEDFNTLPLTGTGLSKDTLPPGWDFVETGTGANATFRAGTGNDNAGDTYSFGPSGDSDRAFGGLLSGSVNPTVGGWFENGGDAPIRSLRVRYTGELWRTGTTGRRDRLEVDLGLTPTALTGSVTAGGWFRVPWLDFEGPALDATGANDGNDAANRELLEHTLVGLEIASGETFFLRWRDFNASGSDDGLGIDDFTLELNPATAPEVDFVKESRTPDTAIPTSGSTLEVDLYLEHASTAPAAAMAQVVVTDTLPPGFNVDPDGITLDLDGVVVTLTPEDDGDAGEIAGGVLTVRLSELEAGHAALVSYRGTLGQVTSDRTISTLATLSFATLDPAMTYSAFAPDAFDVFVTGSARLVFFFDADGDGAQGDTETGLPGFDALVTGSDVVTSGDDGVVSFSGLIPGTLDLLVDAPDAEGAWSFTAPDTLEVVANTETVLVIAVTCSCNDNNVCTTTDRCDRGACFFEDLLDCGEDGDPCTENVCDPTDGCGTVFTTATCDDGDPTTRDDTCDGAGTCEGDAYTCTPGSCEVSATPNGVDCDVVRAEVGASCDDGDNATRNDACPAAGACAGTPYTCDTSTDPCVMIVQDGDGCVPTPINPGGTCDDGDDATRADVCDDSGQCAGTPYTCDETPSPCTTSVPNGDTCDTVPTNAGGTCDDGDSATRQDVCGDDGSCAGTPYTCDASTDPCIRIVPDGDGCVPTPINPGGACDDGDDATRADVCDDSGACAGTPYTCDETPSPCTTSVPNGDTCDTVPTNAGGVCDDGNAGTRQDVCGDDGSCAGTPYTCDETADPCTTSVPNGDTCDVVPTNLGGACDDGDNATRNDACGADGSCVGSPYTCDETADPCTTTVPNGDTCDTVPTNVGGTCDDGDNATRADVCGADGTCAGTPFSCTETDSPCTTSVPNGDTCDTVPTNAGGSCDDGDNATRDDVCDDAGQCAGQTYECPATDDPCTANAQDGSGCVEGPANDGASCDDDDPATRDDVCAVGVCAGTGFTCTPGTCEASSVPNGDGCDVTFEAAGAGCDDGRDDTRDDVCDGEGGCSGTSFTCEPGPCEASSVPNGDGCEVTLVDAGTSCDDGNACTTADACTEGGLCTGEAVSCEAGEVCDVDGECAATHCTACEVDEECGEGAACVELGGEAGRVCLLGCETDEACAEGQVCDVHGEGEAAASYCFDADGLCAASPVDPGPDADPVEPGPEQPGADEGPEVVEGGPDAAPEAPGPQVSGGGGCAGADAHGHAAWLLVAGGLLLALRRRRGASAAR